MTDNDPETSSSPENIEDVLRERNRLEQVLKEKFRKKMAVVFSDISGFTKYVDTWGDIRGRSWLQKHHDMVLPTIDAHGGQVRKIMGDGIMATFPTALAAVNACIAIHNQLDEYNIKTDPEDKIHVHIGVNWGEILLDGNDIAGDAVIVASRIQSQATSDQLLVTKSVYEEIYGNEDILCRFHATAELKGKAEALDLYRVVWKDESIVFSEAPRVRAKTREIKELCPALCLDVTRMKDHLKISAYEQLAGEASTVRHYEEINAPMEQIAARCHSIVETLNRANRSGRIRSDLYAKLREIGQLFADDLFTPLVKEKIHTTQATHMIISLDDQLIQIPWELIHDGHQFLCQKFAMGRLVRTKQDVIGRAVSRQLARPLKMLILSHAGGDLAGAYAEGTQIYDNICRQKDLVDATLRREQISTDYIREKIRNFDIVHFAGHFDYDQKNRGACGWLLSDGHFTARDVLKMGDSAAMPALIFSNACQSARSEEWINKAHFQDEVFDLANAFLLAGVKHYIGTFWEIQDEPSRRFSLAFYRHLFTGASVGEALRQARQTTIREYGEETIAWAGYLLYGDPTFNYLDQIRTQPEDVTTDKPPAYPTQDEKVRATEEVIDISAPAARRKAGRWRVVIAGICAAILLGGGIYFWQLQTGTAKYEADALASYNTGNFDDALQACETIADKKPDVRLVYLLRGNIYMRQGHLDQAEAAFQKALDAGQGTDVQRAAAFNSLGRIASLRKDTDTALKYYQQASVASPESSQGYLSQALLLDKLGQYDAALSLFGKARTYAPDDRLLTSAMNETRKKVLLAQDRDKQERIDQLVRELLKQMKITPRAVPWDGWTSRPLTLWIMDFVTQGYSLQEGEERLLANGITDKLLEGRRAQVVERALFDKLLAELKLGASQLADSRTALSLGRILAARLLLSGHIVYAGPQTQVSLRLIETETGQVSAAITETFGSTVPASVLSDKLSQMLLDKLKKQYPLRGKILSINAEEVQLNIGQRAGVAPGQRFKVTNADVILEVMSTEADSSLARTVKDNRMPQEGQRVEE